MGFVDLNMDMSKSVVVETDKLEWAASPQAGVDRLRLEREDAESGRATSIVRYRAGASFPGHVHGGGEEYLVLDGVFSDASGDYSEGFYVRNPPGSSHAPFSQDGCTIFVKLCQMLPEGEPSVVVDTNRESWESGTSSGHEIKLLFDGPNESVTLERLLPGSDLDVRHRQGVVEILVLDGELQIQERTFGPGTWSRTPANTRLRLASTGTCTFWVKRHRGHIGAPVDATRQ